MLLHGPDYWREQLRPTVQPITQLWVQIQYQHHFPGNRIICWVSHNYTATMCAVLGWFSSLYPKVQTGWLIGCFPTQLIFQDKHLSILVFLVVHSVSYSTLFFPLQFIIINWSGINAVFKKYSLYMLWTLSSNIVFAIVLFNALWLIWWCKSLWWLQCIWQPANVPIGQNIFVMFLTPRWREDPNNFVEISLARSYPNFKPINLWEIPMCVQ